jgi:hypothetical protein
MTKHLEQKPFNFFEALNGGEMLHWTGTPCFISRWISLDPAIVEITTFDGEIIDKVNFGSLEPMDPQDMYFV